MVWLRYISAWSKTWANAILVLTVVRNMNSRTKITLLIFISALAIMFSIASYNNFQDSGFYVSTRKIDTILDDEEKLIHFKIDELAQYPHQAILNFEGHIDGVGIIGFGVSDSAIFVSDTIEGDFKLSYRSDLYSDSCIVKYSPISANNGSISIK